MSGFIGFMNGPVGRTARVLLGVVLITVGVGVIGGVAGLIVAAVGLIPIALGAWGRCMLELVVPGAQTPSHQSGVR